MAVYQWYKTSVNASGTATAESVLVQVWFGPTPPPDPSLYDLVIIDNDGDGLISRDEWRGQTSGPPGQDLGSATALFDGRGGGSGFLYSAVPYPSGATGLKAGLTSDFTPVDPGALQPFVPCFTAGTPIATPGGAVPVETLAPGDLVRTADGRDEPVLALLSTRADGSGADAPIRFAPGALGDHGEVRLSPNHRVLVSGALAELLFHESAVLVLAKSLVNGTTIRAEPVRHVRYHHLLLERHDTVLANGLPAETFHPANLPRTGMPGQTLLSGTPETLVAAYPMLSHGEGRLLARLLVPRATPRPSPGRSHAPASLTRGRFCSSSIRHLHPAGATSGRAAQHSVP